MPAPSQRALLTSGAVAATLVASPATALAWESPTFTFTCEGERAQDVPWGHKWKSLPVRYHVWTSSAAPDAVEAVALEGIEKAFGAWQSVQGGAFTAEYAGVVTGAKIGDGKNDVAWIRSDWYATTGVSRDEGDVLGVTFTQRDWQTGRTADNGACPPVDRCPEKEAPCAAMEGDIFLNAEIESAEWGNVTDEGSLAFAVLTHEVGHLLGLGHSSGFTPEALMDPTPVAIDGVPILRADDVAGVTALYSDDAPLCEGALDCAVGDGCNVNCDGISADICASESCARAERCVDGACEEVTGTLGAPCRLDGKPGCDESLTCAAGQGEYIGRCTGPCDSDPTCAPDGKCREVAAGGEKVCVFPGDLADGAACGANSDCRSAACVKDKCADSCETDCDCDDGLACRGGACLKARSTCYFRDGRPDNRRLSATLCSAAAGRRAARSVGGVTAPWTAWAVLLLGAARVGVRARRRLR